MDATPLPRSPELLSRTASALLVVDVQGKMLANIPAAPRIVWNLQRLIRGAKLFQVPIEATEQNPDKLGPSVAELAAELPPRLPKLAFSCAACETLLPSLRDRGLYKTVVAGIETHVCVLQTALDLLAEGFRVYIPVDACGSRHTLDEQIAWRRLEAAGATLVTTESVLFEWCEAAGTAEFRQISELIKQSGP